jgi:hypothetical protein
MLRDLAAVHPDMRLVIHSAEVQDRTPVTGYQMEFPLVPATTVQTAVTDTARLRFGREGYLDGQRPIADIRGALKVAVIVI